MRIAISGAAGFLGSHLARRFTDDGHTAVAFDMVHPSSAWRLHDLAHPERLEYHWGDIGELLTEAKAVDAVIHCAAITNINYAWRNPRAAYQQMLGPLISVMEAAKAGWTKRVILISTHSVYGHAIGRPFTEDDLCQPMNLYGALKLAQEGVLLAYAKAYNLDATVLRMALMYGENERDDATPRRFMEMAARGETIKLEGGGYQTRDFNYVGNAVDAVIRCLRVAGISGEIFNISGGEDISIRDLALRSVSYTERGAIIDVPTRPGEEGNIRMDYSKAQGALGYRPQVDFTTGFPRLAKWVLAREKAQ